MQTSADLLPYFETLPFELSRLILCDYILAPIHILANVLVCREWEQIVEAHLRKNGKSIRSVAARVINYRFMKSASNVRLAADLTKRYELGSEFIMRAVENDSHEYLQICHEIGIGAVLQKLLIVENIIYLLSNHKWQVLEWLVINFEDRINVADLAAQMQAENRWLRIDCQRFGGWSQHLDKSGTTTQCKEFSKKLIAHMANVK